MRNLMVDKIIQLHQFKHPKIQTVKFLFNSLSDIDSLFRVFIAVDCFPRERVLPPSDTDQHITIQSFLQIIGNLRHRHS